MHAKIAQPQSSLPSSAVILATPLLIDQQEAVTSFLIQTNHAASATNQVLWFNGPEDSFGIEQLRDLYSYLAAASTALQLTLVFLSAETLSAETQNALLKHLEEPPAGVSFILATPEPTALLTTIQSRCVLVDMRTALPQLSETQTKKIMDVIQQLDTDPTHGKAITLSNAFTNREQALDWITMAIIWAQSQKNAPAASAAVVTRWSTWQSALLHARQLLQANAHVKLVMDTVFFQYLSTTDLLLTSESLCASL